MNKQEILEDIKKATELKPYSNGSNSMGRCENNYNPYYAIGQCFTEEELIKMSEQELINLIKLGEYLSEAFY